MNALSGRGARVLAVAAGVVTILLVTFGIFVLAPRPAPATGPHLSDAPEFKKIRAAAESLPLPATYSLVSQADSGGRSFLSFLDDDSGPTEVRVYRVSDPSNAPGDFIRTLRRSGFTVDSPLQCAFTARRGHVGVYVQYQQTPNDPVGGPPDCPGRRWPSTYAWTVFSFD